MELEIKKAQINDAEIVYNILLLCGKHLEEKFGLTHWSPPYPLESIKTNIQEREVYLVFCENQYIATFTIGVTPIANYDPKRWKVAASKVMYLNRLAVLPTLQGNSLGSWCMKEIENLASQAGCQALRFDAVAKHEKLLGFYKKLGYQSLGLWQLQDARATIWDVMLFEKQL